MSNIPISSLPLAISLDGSESVPIVQGGATKRATVLQIATGIIGIPASAVTFTQTGVGAVEVTFDTLLRKKVYTPEMFGAVSAPYPTAAVDVPDSTVALNRLMAAIKLNGSGIARFGPGVYKTTTGIVIDSARIQIEGDVEQGTWIIGELTSPGSVVQFGTGASQLYYCGIRNISIGSSETTLLKNGIRLVDVSRFTLDTVTVAHYPQDGSLFSGGGASVGLLIQGRDTSVVNALTSYAEIPKVIDKNPNSTITLDSFNFHSCNYVGHLDGSTTNPLILVTPEAETITKLVYDGTQNWQGGTDGFKCIRTNSVVISGLTFSGIKSEQSFDSVAGVSGYTFNIQSNNRVDGVAISNSSFGDRNGIKYRNVLNSKIDGITFDPVKALEALNIDSTVGTFEIENSTWLDGLFAITATTTGLNLVQKSATPAGRGLSTLIPPRGMYSTGLTETFINIASSTFNNVGLSSAGATAAIGLGSGKNVQFTNSLTYNGVDGSTIEFGSGGTVAYVGGSGGAALTRVDDTNVTATLGGSPATALLNAASITLGWTGTLAASRGGTGLSVLGTGVATALGINVGSAGAFVTNGGALGTPSSGVATNLTGTASGLTAGTVTTNANLTGDVTSVGNATTLATVNSNVGTFGDGTHVSQVTVNAKGQVTAASSVAITGAAPTGAAGGDLTGTYPNPTLAAIISAGGPTGSATVAPIITYDAKGRLTAVSSATITPAIGSITGLGTGVATALAINVGSAGAPVTFNGALGTPSSGTGANLTGIPISTGLSGAGTGVLTALGINIGSAGAPILFNGAGGTPSSIVLTNASGTAASLTAGNVTTNANLTGDVTSVGNATTLTNAPVIAKVLTGYVSGAGTVSAADSILSAIQKLNGNDALKLPLAGGTLTGALLFSTDNTLDIGASGATRPRTGYYGTSLVVPLIAAAGALTFQSNGSTFAGSINTSQQWLMGTSASISAGNPVLTITKNSATLPQLGTPLLQIAQADATQTTIVVQSFNAGAFSQPTLQLAKARGTAASPAAVQSADLIGAIFGYGYATSGGAGYVTGAGAGMVFTATDNFTSTVAGERIDFYSTATGAGSSSIAASVGAGLMVGTTIDPGAGLIYINSASFLMRNKTSWTNGAAAAAGTLLNAPVAGNPTKWIPIDDNGTTRYVPAW